jgi:hypothetical protein
MRRQWPGMVGLALALVAALNSWGQSPAQKRSAPRAARSDAPKITGVWLGQDGHDLASPSPAAEPSGVQDVHIVLKGLSPANEIEFAAIKGLGSDEWQVNGPWGPWKAVMVYGPNKTTADIYFEPAKVETGRPFEINLRFKDRTTTTFFIGGGKADPGLRMPDAAVAPRWVGQDRQDRVGLGPNVGPDGRQDAHIEISHLTKNALIDCVTIEGPQLTGWRTGSNPDAKNNAELIRRGDDPSKADLFFQPDGNLAGTKLKVTVFYAKTKPDSASVAAARTDPKLMMPQSPGVAMSRLKLKTRWLGQDGTRVTGDGDVHVLLEGLPPKPVVSATMSNGTDAMWDWRQHGPSLEWSFPIAFRPSPDRTRADLFFAPDRDESGGVMTLRIGFQDGQTAFAQFPGGTADPALRCAPPKPIKISAKPGDNLQDLAERFGSIHLTAGAYRLDRPLILRQAVHLSAEKGAVLRFQQPADAAPWTAAIKILSGRTTLEGFAVRFEGPVRWNWDVEWGPTVIASSDNLDSGPAGTVGGVVIRGLDLESPPNPGAWAQAPSLMRFMTALNGLIEKNTLKGGTIELRHGPWRVLDNDHRGTPPNTFTTAAFTVHFSHDLLLARNRVVPVQPAGKTWRFLVLTHYGANDVVRENVVEKVGPRDDDIVPHPNTPEVILTESYRLHFEGRPEAVTADGWLLRIPPPQEAPARIGDVVAILSGPKAGEWRRIAQAVDQRTYLMESPLPAGDAAISIGAGFVNEQFIENRVDSRGSSVAVNMVLVGNHFGTRIVGNHLLGGGSGWMLSASASEQPVHWGWSHNPFLGAVVERNILEDGLHAGTISVAHGPAMKSNRGRVYMTMSLKDTTVRWSDAFVRKSAPRDKLVGLMIGEEGSLDAGELVVAESGTKTEIPSGHDAVAVRIRTARVNGQDRSITPAPRR